MPSPKPANKKNAASKTTVTKSQGQQAMLVNQIGDIKPGSTDPKDIAA